jgi:hypothetical protein
MRAPGLERGARLQSRQAVCGSSGWRRLVRTRPVGVGDLDGAAALELQVPALEVDDVVVLRAQQSTKFDRFVGPPSSSATRGALGTTRPVGRSRETGSPSRGRTNEV